MLGQTLGHYRIVKEIGAGGMGVAYLARDERLDRDIVLKVLPAERDSDKRARARLVREARMASALNHPYICTIYEVGEEDGHAFIAMEHVVGRTLSELQAPMQPREITRYGCQIAEALEHAHARGIIHRDLKTANVMITAEGRVKVLDFGLAKRLATDDLLESTRSQSFVADEISGTLPYMAPEVLRGMPADGRGDVWALGVVLYEIGAGVRPFQRESRYELVSAILRDDPPPLPPEVPAGLAGVILRCLAKEPRERYQRAGEVRAALESCQAGPATVTTAKRAARNWVKLVGAVLVLLAIVLAAASVHWYLGTREPIRSVAILPFSGSSTDTEYLSDGITDSLIDSVSRLPDLKVISHTSVFHYKGKDVDPRAVGQELKVGAVLTGRVVPHGDGVSVSVELVDTKDNTRLWGRQYTRKLSDVVAMQRDISQEIGDQLRPRLSAVQRRRLGAQPTENSEAYELFLRGRYYAMKRTAEGIETSRHYYEQAIAKDPAFALAYAGLADYYFFTADDGLIPPREGFPKAKAAALKALSIDPDLGLGHTELGWALLYDWDLPEAEREFKRAMELTPNWPETYRGYAIYLRTMGRLDEAIATDKHARELDPLSVSRNSSLGWTLYYAHRYPEAIEQFRTSLAMDPGFLSAQLGLANAYQQNGMEKEAIEALQTYITASGSADFASELGETYAKSGFRAAMRIFWQTALNFNAEAAKHRYTSPTVFASLYSLLGDKDQAFRWLEKAYEERSSKLLELELDPDFDSLHGDPRYDNLLRRVGLPLRATSSHLREPSPQTSPRSAAKALQIGFFAPAKTLKTRVRWCEATGC